MHEAFSFIGDLASTGAATITVSVAGLALTLGVAVKSKSKLRKSGLWVWRGIKSIFSSKN